MFLSPRSIGWGHTNGVPIRDINPQTLKTIDLIIAIDIHLEALKIQTYPALEDEACLIIAIKHYARCMMRVVRCMLEFAPCGQIMEIGDDKCGMNIAEC
jgi:hypothetical protein